MRYSLIGDNNLFNPVESVLKNRGIEDINRFLKAGETPSEEIHFSKLKNIEKAVDSILYHIEEKNSEIFVQIDPDFDGMVSSAMLVDYLQENLDANIVWRHQDGKQHGILSENVSDNIGLVIVPDAGSNDYEEHEKLKKRGIDVIVIDHHLTDKESEYAIVVNNQLDNYPNKHLSGAGVVYKVLQQLDYVLEISESKKYLDMVACSIVSDMMSLESYENRYYITQGLSNIKNPFLREVLFDSPYVDKNNITPKNISFNLAPFVNAVIRVGTNNEKEVVFKALLCKDDSTKSERYIEETVALVKEIKERQDFEVEEQVDYINEIIEKKSLLDNKILAVDVSDKLDGGLTGLVANKLLGESKRPTLVLRSGDSEDVLSGSGRGYEKGYVKNFKEFLSDNGEFDLLAGHENAFGVKIKKKEFVELIKRVNERYKNVEFGSSEYLADFILEDGELNYPFIHQVDSHNELWGQGVEEPTVVVENVEVERRQISIIGKDKNVIKFSSKDIEYIKFRSTNEEIEALLMGGNSMDIFTLNIVGQVGINEFRGKRTGQVIIEDFEIVEVGEREFIF